ncbi:MAG: hypothetical protein KAG20_11490 [Cocleimonas sp.]|nr:hypothetical protein [Cocleimonas sp.]
MLSLATKSLGIHLVPAGTLLVGGLLGWQLWQQHKKSKQYMQTQEKVTDQLTRIQQELIEVKQQNEHLSEKLSAQKEKKSLSRLFKPSPQADEKSSKGGLFKQLITDNIALRKAH